MDFCDAILRPHSSVMSSHPGDKKIIMKTLEEAGYQLIKEGKISHDKLELISKPLIPFKDYLNKETNDYLSVKNQKN